MPPMPIKILAVDDETLNGELLERVFRGNPTYQLTVCNSPELGLEHLRTKPIDVVLLDQSMPEMSGVDFVKRAREEGLEPIFVMVTAYPEMKQVVQAWNDRLVRFVVPKPWRAPQLLATIERAFAR